jgi:hypothetical protein
MIVAAAQFDDVLGLLAVLSRIDGNFHVNGLDDIQPARRLQVVGGQKTSSQQGVSGHPRHAKAVQIPQVLVRVDDRQGRVG